MLFAALTLILTVIVVAWGGRTWLKNSETVVFAVGDGNSLEARFAAKLLANILGDDSGSRLYWELVDSGIAECANMGHHEFQGAGVFVTYMSCAPEQAVDNLRRMQDVLRQAEALLQRRNCVGVSPLGTVGVHVKKSRRMNAGNAKAARRSIRRIKAVRHLLTSIEREMPHRHCTRPHSKARFARA